MPHLEQDLDRLRHKLLAMASLADRALSQAMQALVERNDSLAEHVQDEDNRFDRLEVEVDDDAIGLLVKAPLARHLRAITVAMKISRDLERVGDEATTIARRVLRLNSEPALVHCPGLATLAQLALGMADRAVESLVCGDAVQARAVRAQDAEADRLHQQCYSDLAVRFELEPQCINRGLHLIVVAKSLERVADHAKNIAEYVVFLQEGQDIRHAGHDHVRSTVA